MADLEDREQVLAEMPLDASSQHEEPGQSPVEGGGASCSELRIFCVWATSFLATARMSWVPQPPGTGSTRGVTPSPDNSCAISRISEGPPLATASHSWSSADSFIVQSFCLPSRRSSFRFFSSISSTLGVSRIFGIPANRESCMTKPNPFFPIRPSPICIWRSR